ncbi:uncharacterized protein LOC120295885 [Eucalyptus grandis]|uniref:uncharacterized protein LOC120295885 n=1 Tax=Eucalyptus grandis TaxID=71139 RepID=UPI00192EB92B|nr:uncharacterized protein LOC120295885 [Eucalyptus grandis]
MNIPTAPPEVPVVEPVAKRHVEEIPTAIPIVIGPEPPSKEIPTSHFDEENARRLAKIKERLCMLQGYQLQGFDKLSPFAKITVLIRSRSSQGNTTASDDSLVGSALTWFIELDMKKIRTWEDLVDEFLQQYKFNTEIAPTQEELVQVEKRRTESFRAYAQRWRVIVSQVKPPLSEKETMKLLLQAMPRDFFEKMYNHTCMNFATFVELGERIEGIMREGRLTENINRRYTPKRDKESAVEIAYIQNSFSQKPYTTFKLINLPWK